MTCPNCGYCKYCKRGGIHPQPWYPYQPYQPYPYWSTTGTPPRYGTISVSNTGKGDIPSVG